MIASVSMTALESCERWRVGWGSGSGRSRRDFYREFGKLVRPRTRYERAGARPTKEESTMRDSICKIEHCKRKVHARQLCAPHYLRWRRCGDVFATVPIGAHRPRGMTPGEAFLYFMPDSPPIADCWHWQGPLTPSGYGCIQYVTGEKALAHRVAYELFVGPIPEGLFACHHCDNPPCCNPNHLYAGTPADNSRDMVARGRSLKGRPRRRQ
jgi:hypothetical protein